MIGKKFLSIVLALTMILSMMPTSALAVEATEAPVDPPAEDVQPTQGTDPEPAAAETAVAKIGEKTYSTLKEAMDAATETDTIVILEPQNAADLAGRTGRKYIFQVDACADTCNGRQCLSAFYVENEITLSGVNIEIRGTTKGNIAHGGAFYVAPSGHLRISGNSQIMMTGLRTPFVFHTEPTGQLTIDGAVVTAKDIRGNFSNGGQIHLNNATVTLNNCSDYGISSKVLTMVKSQVTMDKIGYAGVNIDGDTANNAPAGAFSMDAESTLSITNSGAELPLVSKWSGTYAPIELGFKGNVAVEIADAAKIALSGNVDKNGKEINYIHAHSDAEIPYVAFVNGTGYKTLEAAVNAAQPYDTVTLLKDVVLSETVVLDKNIKLDLNGKTVSSAEGFDAAQYLFESKAPEVKYKKVQIYNGSIVSATARGVHATAGRLYIEGVNMSTFKRCLHVEHAEVKLDQNSVLEICQGGIDPAVFIGSKDTTQTKQPTLEVKAAKLDASKGLYTYAAIQGNGSDTSNPYIKVFDGAELISAGDAIYAPQEGLVYIYGGTLTGSTAIEIRAGRLYIKNGVFNATAEAFAEQASGNGSTIEGAAVAVSQHNTNKDLDVTVLDGTFNGIYAFYEKDLQDANVANITGSIRGGNFNGKVYSQNLKNFIKEGVFAEAPAAEYIAVGYSAQKNADGKFVVAKKPVAMIGAQGYETLRDAVDAAKNGDTVKLVKNIEVTKDSGIEQICVTTKMTLDFNGFTITTNHAGKNNNAVLFVNNGGELTLKGEGGIKVLNGGYCVHVNGADAVVNVEAGTYHGAVTAINVQKGVANVNGGTFTVAPTADGKFDYLLNCIDSAYTDGSAKIVVKGGSFAKFDPAKSNGEPNGPADFVAPGYMSQTSGENFEVVSRTEKTPDVVVPETVAPEVGTAASQVTAPVEAPKATAEEQTKAEALGGETVTFNTYLDIKVEAYDASAEAQSFKLDITPMAIATTTVGDKTVAFGDARPVDTVGKSVTVTIPLPEGFAKVGDDLLVIHTKDSGVSFTHKVTVQQGKAGKYVSFENTNGFSKMEVRSLDAKDTQYDMKAVVKGADKDFDAGEELVVEIYGIAKTGAPNMISFQFTMADVPGLTLKEIAAAEPFDGITGTFIPNGSSAAYTGSGNGVGLKSAADGGTLLATVTYTVNEDAAEGKAAIGFDTSKTLEITGYLNKVGTLDTAIGDSANLHNIKITLNGGNGTVDSADSKTLYAKYNVAGLFSNAARTEAVTDVAVAGKTGYRVANGTTEPQWMKGTESFNTFADILKVVHTADAAYDLQTVEQVNVTFTPGEHVTGTETVVAVDKGATWADVEKPTFTVADYYTAAWKKDGTTDMQDADQIDADLKVVYVATANTFDFSANTTLTDLNGAANGKATYGTDVTFKVQPVEGKVIKQVTYTVGGADATILTADSNGVYKIDGVKVTGAVAVEVTWTEYVTITFKNGTGVEALSATAYAYKDTAKLYSGVAATQLTGTFTVPTAAAAEGYRLAADNAAEPLWSDGSSKYQSTALGASVSFSANTTLTAQAVKQWTVTFAADTNGAITGTAAKVVDEGYVLQSGDIPAYKANAGYVFDKWDVTPEGQTITADKTFTAQFKHGTYTITLPKLKGVEFTVTGADKNEDGTYTATHGKDVTITMNAPLSGGSKVTELSYKIGEGADVVAKADANGITSHTIELDGAAITGAVSITLKSSEMVNITVTAGEGGKVNEKASDTKTFDKGYLLKADDFKITADAGYVVDANNIPAAGAAMNADATYAVTFKHGTFTVTLPGDKTVSGTHGTDLTITPDGIVSGVQYAGADGVKKDAVKNEDGTYTIPGADITGDLTVTYTQPEGLDADATWELITNDKFFALPVNSMNVAEDQVAILHTSKKAAGAFALDNVGDMFWSAKYDGYVQVVGADETEGTLSAKLASTANQVVVIDYEGDTNRDERTTGADSAVVNAALYKIEGLTYEIDARMILEMDVNGDKKVTTTDIQWILCKAVGKTPVEVK